MYIAYMMPLLGTVKLDVVRGSADQMSSWYLDLYRQAFVKLLIIMHVNIHYFTIFSLEKLTCTLSLKNSPGTFLST